MNTKNINPTLVNAIISCQFPEYSHLAVTKPKKQGHDNHTFKLGKTMIVRLPTQQSYSQAVNKEQRFLPVLAPHLKTRIPKPVRLGMPSNLYPYHFSIYEWIPGKSLDVVNMCDQDKERLSLNMVEFLQELQDIVVSGPSPGQHNWWRGGHISIYEKDAKKQFSQLSGMIDANKATQLWDAACKTKWSKRPVWIHGDLSAGNILIQKNKLCAVIDFGCMGVGDPACDFGVAWTLFNGKAREVFISKSGINDDVWLRAKAWILWKSTFDLCNVKNDSAKAIACKNIINDVLNEY